MASSKQKGDKNELEARTIYEDAGYLVENPNFYRYGNKDFFNLFDFMAIRPDSKVVFGQVKTNRAQGINAFADEVREHFNFDHVIIEYWVRYNREGWRVIQITPDGREDIIDERDSSENIGDVARREKSKPIEEQPMAYMSE